MFLRKNYLKTPLLSIFYKKTNDKEYHFLEKANVK